MDNKAISRALKLLSQLMELHDENTFKVRSVANASFKIDKLPFPASTKTTQELEAIDGIGKSTALRIQELVQTGQLAELTSLLSKTPEGILDILSVKGLGPKKVQTIWKELEIESIGELLYACNENRLIEAKGFGLKTQEEVRNAIEFKMAGTGKFLYARAESYAFDLLGKLKLAFPSSELSLTGDFRRFCEIIETVDFLVATTDYLPGINQFSESSGIVFAEHDSTLFKGESASGLKVVLNFCKPEEFGYQLLLTTGNEDHVAEIQKRLSGKSVSSLTEEEIYSIAGFPFIEPELREGLSEFHLAEKGISKLIVYSDLKGSLHNHSTWSDGVHTLEEMAQYCRNQLSLQYLGICDHSKTAVYAKGLSEERVLAQQQEIDQLNITLAPFRIFKGIESDILPDGSLDYPDEILSTFDFVVASIHSVFKMSEERATDRLIKAIENPYTTILGHPTGRLLLSRSGYPVDFKKVIDACAANRVVIEINANPLRLDMDWRWHQYAVEKGVLLSVNPDAHRTEGFYDMHYGIYVARKGGLLAENCLNTFDLDQISEYFISKKK